MTKAEKKILEKLNDDSFISKLAGEDSMFYFELTAIIIAAVFFIVQIAIGLLKWLYKHKASWPLCFEG